MNYQLRKVAKTRGYFPNDQPATKLLWFAFYDLGYKRALERAKAHRSNAGF